MRYFTNYWNLIDLVYLTLNLYVIVSNFLGAFFDFGDITTARVVASVSAIFLWSKVLDWLRLFDGTAFYIFLIEITVRDIGSFLIIMLISYMMYGTAFYLLNLNRSEDSALIAELAPFYAWPLNVFVNQYALSLGEFDLDTFGEGPNTIWCYGYFVVASFMIIIIFLNMLIAIMADSFSQAIEQRQLNGIKEKLSIMSDYIYLIAEQDAQD